MCNNASNAAPLHEHANADPRSHAHQQKPHINSHIMQAQTMCALPTAINTTKNALPPSLRLLTNQKQASRTSRTARCGSPQTLTSAPEGLMDRLLSFFPSG